MESQSFHPMCQQLFALLLCVLFIGTARAQVTVNSFNVPYTSPGYLVDVHATDGIAGTNLHRIVATAELDFTTTSSYRVDWSLIGPADGVVATSSTVLGANVSGIRNVTSDLRPGSALTLGVLYRVKMVVLDTLANVTVRTRTESPGHTYLHFTGTNPGTAPVNVLAVVDSVTVDRDWLLETDSSKTTLPVTVNYTLHRYDAWTTAPTGSSISVRFDNNTVNQPDGPGAVAGTWTNTTTTSGVSSNTGGAAPAPASASGSLTMQFDPAAVGDNFRSDFSIGIEHLENATTTVWKTGQTGKLKDAFYTHMSGQLNFGSIVTTFTSITTFAPPAGPPGIYFPGIAVNRVITIPAGAGSLAGFPNNTYSGTIGVSIDNGIATCRAGESTTLIPASPLARLGTLNSVPFYRSGTITLDSTGAHLSEIQATLPVGVGWASNRTSNILNSDVTFGAVDLTQNLAPSAPVVLNSAIGTFFMCEETKPLYIGCPTLTWDPALGEFQAGPTALQAAFSIRQPLLDWLAAQPVRADMMDKKSNDHLYNHVSGMTNVTWKTGPSNGGEMSGVMISGHNKLTTHFPYASDLDWTGGFITVAGDLINPATSGFTGVLPAFVLYMQHCAQAVLDGCGSEEYADVTVTPADYKITGDGGIQFPGPPTMSPLAWGYISANAGGATSDDFAHTVTSAFPTSNFLMAGTFLRGDQNPIGDEDGPSVLLLSGFDPADLANAERPAGTGYEGGNADYAGVNFRCTPSGFQGQSTLQDSMVGPYSLTTRSKYYARWSGVTGIHEAPAGGFPGAAILGGYDFTFDSFGFSFLSNEMEESRADGALAIDAPVDETFEFTGLRFTCLGMLDSFELDLPSGVDPKTFAYWSAPITPYSAEFVATNECDPGAGTTFVLGFKAHVAHLAEDVSGQLGILPDGNFAVPADPSSTVADSVPTRLALPSVMTFDGPTGETYTFMPAQLGYFNNPDKGSDASGIGYWNFFGTLDVPFFKDMQVNLHTRCYEDSSAMLDLMGGWPTKGWTDASGDPFSSILFDLQNAGFPWDVAGVSTEDYRSGNTSNEKWLPRAQQEWLGGIINFDYPCTWNSTTRDFAGVPLPPLNLLILEAEHQLTYLSADNAELEFGVQYGDLPSISVANLAFTALDEATNFGADWVTSQSDKVFNGLGTAVDEFSTMLEDKAEALVDEALQRVTDPWLDALINEIKALPTVDPVAFRAAAKAKVHAYLITNTDNLTKQLQKLVDGTDAAQDLLADLNMRLERVKQGLKGVTSILNLDPSTISITDLDGTPLASAAAGLLAKNGTTGEREALTLLASALIDLLSTIAVDSGVQDSLKNVLAELEPTLDTISATIDDIYDIVTEVQTQVNGAGELVQALRNILTTASAKTVLDALSATLDTAIQQIVDVPDIDLSQLAVLAEEWKEEIRQEIRDALYATQLIADVQQAVKERLYDVQQAFNQAIDSAFAAVNQAIRDALEPALDELDSAISDLTGNIADKIGAGSIEGYAHFNADSLDLLRLDGDFEFKLDEPFILHAYLEIKELDSDGGAGSICTAAGVDATEVTIGVEDFGVTFMSSEIRMDIETKFALSADAVPIPIGLGGSFEMTEGEIDYETFKITELGAAVMFGLTENYLGAKVALEFGSYAAAGGFFIGTTCDPDPLLMIDPLIGSLVSTPFSGIYAYGECEFPIYGTGTCLFNISGKAGAGVLYNSVVPEYGGRMTLGVTGEALCAVTIGGEVSLAGVKSGSVYNFAGTGRLFGEVGKCPFCIGFDKTVGFTYTDAGGWDVDY